MQAKIEKIRSFFLDPFALPERKKTTFFFVRAKRTDRGETPGKKSTYTITGKQQRETKRGKYKKQNINNK